MVIIINKDTDQEEIKSALKKIEANPKKLNLKDFYGKMKGKFGDGLSYQQKLRNEWD